MFIEFSIFPSVETKWSLCLFLEMAFSSVQALRYIPEPQASYIVSFTITLQPI